MPCAVAAGSYVYLVLENILRPVPNPSFRNFEIEYPSFRNFGIELQILIEIIQMNCKDKVMVLVPIINKNFGKYFRILSNIKMSQIN
jgi:hypothetical protein